jgi:hypothetical protein
MLSITAAKASDGSAEACVRDSVESVISEPTGVLLFGTNLQSLDGQVIKELLTSDKNEVTPLNYVVDQNNALYITRDDIPEAHDQALIAVAEDPQTKAPTAHFIIESGTLKRDKKLGFKFEPTAGAGRISKDDIDERLATLHAQAPNLSLAEKFDEGDEKTKVLRCTQILSEFQKKRNFLSEAALMGTFLGETAYQISKDHSSQDRQKGDEEGLGVRVAAHVVQVGTANYVSSKDLGLVADLLTGITTKTGINVSKHEIIHHLKSKPDSSESETGLKTTERVLSVATIYGTRILLNRTARKALVSNLSQTFFDQCKAGNVVTVMIATNGIRIVEQAIWGTALFEVNK